MRWLHGMVKVISHFDQTSLYEIVSDVSEKGSSHNMLGYSILKRWYSIVKDPERTFAQHTLGS